jgi:hypothetical protein
LEDNEENIFEHANHRLTNGDIDHTFLLKSIPQHQVVDLRSLDLNIDKMGPAIKNGDLTTVEKVTEAFSKSQFDTESIEKIKNLIQQDKSLQDEIALLIINDNAAIVLNPDYLIDLEAKKNSLKTENLGHIELPQNVLSSDAFLKESKLPEDVNLFLNQLTELYDLYRTHLTPLQEKEISAELNKFIKNRNGLKFDRVFMFLHEKISLLKQIPATKLTEKQISFITMADELYQKSLIAFDKAKQALIELHRDEFQEDAPLDEIDYQYMQAFKEPLLELTEALRDTTKV